MLYFIEAYVVEKRLRGGFMTGHIAGEACSVMDEL